MGTLEWTVPLKKRLQQWSRQSNIGAEAGPNACLFAGTDTVFWQDYYSGGLGLVVVRQDEGIRQHLVADYRIIANYVVVLVASCGRCRLLDTRSHDDHWTKCRHPKQHTTPFRPMIVPFDDLELVYQSLRNPSRHIRANFRASMRRIPKWAPFNLET
jgi:hypothetical protein